MMCLYVIQKSRQLVLHNLKQFTEIGASVQEHGDRFKNLHPNAHRITTPFLTLSVLCYSEGFKVAPPPRTGVFLLIETVLALQEENGCHFICRLKQIGFFHMNQYMFSKLNFIGLPFFTYLKYCTSYFKDSLRIQFPP